MTASTLYEAVEPHIIWKHLLMSIINEIVGNSDHCEVSCQVFFRNNTIFHHSSFLFLFSGNTHGFLCAEKVSVSR
jgi:hypothetical protein